MGGEYVLVDRPKLLHLIIVFNNFNVWVGQTKLLHCFVVFTGFLVWVDRPKLLLHLLFHEMLSNMCCWLIVQDFKYQMINKFSSINNACHKHKKYNELRGEIYLITASDSVWGKWRSVFEKYETGDLIDPDTGMLFNQTACFKQMKPLVREFFRALQGLSETEMGKTVKRCWVHPKIVFTKPKIFVPSCYTMKEWTENRKKKTTIV